MQFVIDKQAQGMSRDQIIIEMVMQQGMTINQATKIYAAIAKDQGWTAAVSSYKEEAMDWLRATYPESDWDFKAVRDAVAYIQSEWSVAESTARDYTKAYSDELGVEQPKEDTRALIFDWCKTNVPNMSKDEARKALRAYIVDELGRTKSNANEYVKGLDLYFHLSA